MFTKKNLKHLVCILLWIIMLPLRIAFAIIGTPILIVIGILWTLLDLQSWACRDDYLELSILPLIKGLYWNILLKNDFSVLA